MTLLTPCHECGQLVTVPLDAADSEQDALAIDGHAYCAQCALLRLLLVTGQARRKPELPELIEGSPPRNSFNLHPGVLATELDETGMSG